jgi:hypothetical protein
MPHPAGQWSLFARLCLSDALRCPPRNHRREREGEDESYQRASAVDSEGVGGGGVQCVHGIGSRLHGHSKESGYHRPNLSHDGNWHVTGTPVRVY